VVIAILISTVLVGSAVVVYISDVQRNREAALKSGMSEEEFKQSLGVNHDLSKRTITGLEWISIFIILIVLASLLFVLF
jgi:hypothetical protein